MTIFPDARRIRLVCDGSTELTEVNLSIHDPLSLYEAFETAEAHRLARRLVIHFTPKHGSWLHIAEIELSVMIRQSSNGRCVRTRSGVEGMGR